MSGKKKLFAALMCALVLCLLCAGAGMADQYIKYEKNEGTGKYEPVEHNIPETAKVLMGAEETLTGWYVAEGDITFNDCRPYVSGDVHLILKDGCTLEANRSITVNEGNSLSIYAQSEDDNMGALTVSAQDYDAGIGGTIGNGSGTITIHGGTVNATANGLGAAIGGGYEGSSTVTIYGGTVTAETGTSSAGAAIGGGSDGSGTVTIYGGKINAIANGYGAAIGTGNGYMSSGTVTIYGGTVTAETGSKSQGSAIGSGSSNMSSGTVTIHDGTVIATTNGGGAAIGGSGLFESGTVTIHGGTVNATTNGGGAAIGGSQYSSGTITINGGEITATANGGGAAIGNGYEGSGSKVFLGWTDADNDFIKSDSYSGEVTLEEVFQYEDKGVTKYTAGAISDIGVLGGKKLQPLQGTPNCSISASVSPDEGGTVSGGGTHGVGSNVTVTATSNPGYRFVNWTEGEKEVSKDAAYTFIVLENRTLTANFEKLPPFDAEHVNFVIPAGSIGANAFAGDEAIAIVDASLCTSIGEHAFRVCRSLTQILLPADCDFPSSAFEGCEALVAIYAPGGGKTQASAAAAGIPFMPVE